VTAAVEPRKSRRPGKQTGPGPVRRYRWGVWALSAPAVLAMVALLGYPLIVQLITSLKSVNSTGDHGWVGLKNYGSVLTDGSFWHSVLVTAQFAAICLVLEFVLGLALALAVNRVLVGGGPMRVLILIPTMITPAVAAINFRLIMNANTGILNWFTSLVGLPEVNWVADPATAMWALAAVDIWRSTPFVILVLSAGLLSMSVDVLEAAQLDGASAWRTLVLIKMPMLTPLILVVVLFRIIDLFRTFDLPFILTQGGPAELTNVASLQIYADMFSGYFTSYAATEGIIFTAITLVFGLMLVRSLRADQS